MSFGAVTGPEALLGVAMCRADVSVRHAPPPRLIESIGMPLEFIKEPAGPTDVRRVARRSVILELVLHLRHRMNGWNARHSEFSERGSKLHGRPNAAESSGGGCYPMVGAATARTVGSATPAVSFARSAPRLKR